MPEDGQSSDAAEPAPAEPAPRPQLEASQGTAKLLDSLLDRLAGRTKPVRPEQLTLGANLTDVIARRDQK